MLHTSLVNKLNKAGFKIEDNGRSFYVYSKNNKQVLEWHTQKSGEKLDVVCLKYRSVNDRNDIMTDYHAGFYVDSIKWAMDLITRGE
jgi:hypothetical protein